MHMKNIPDISTVFPCKTVEKPVENVDNPSG